MKKSIAEKKPKFKLVVFDVDGTILDDITSAWLQIHTYVKSDMKERNKFMGAFYKKKISYEEWAYLDVSLWKKMGVRKKDILAAFRKVRLMPGTKETLSFLRKKGIKLAIISGSLDVIIAKYLPGYKKYFSHILINRLYFHRDGTIKKLKPTMYDMEHKLTGLLKICRQMNIKPSEAAFVGDNFNDIHIAQIAGLSIAFCPNSEKYAKVCDVIIREKDLSLILKHIL